MKKILFFIFLLMFSMSFSKENKINNISEIKTLELVVNEETFINTKSEKKLYTLKYVVPNFLKKEMIEPKSHKGEIFVYNNGIKETYLPIFDEVIRDEKAPEENFVIDTISLLQNKDKNDKSFRKLYNSGKNIQIRNNKILIKLENMVLVKNCYMPSQIRIFEGDSLIGKLMISDIKINEKIDEKEFITK